MFFKQLITDEKKFITRQNIYRKHRHGYLVTGKGLHIGSRVGELPIRLRVYIILSHTW